jgi:nicotinate-nucleotide adenylyltransferase
VTARPAPIVPGSIGIFGGTFDPIHVAHLAVAQAAAEAIGLECVLFVPAGRPPHKLDVAITSAEHRLAMVRLAIEGNERFAVDSLEIDRAGPSYTVDTLEAIRSRHATGGSATDGARPDGSSTDGSGPDGSSTVSSGPDLAIIVSVEAYRQLPSWRDPARIVELARIVVAPRDGYADAAPDALAGVPGGPARTVFLDKPRLRLSASELRTWASEGRSLRYLVPDAVAAYISDHGLYRNRSRTD